MKWNTQTLRAFLIGLLLLTIAANNDWDWFMLLGAGVWFFIFATETFVWDKLYDKENF